MHEMKHFRRRNWLRDKHIGKRASFHEGMK